MDLKVSKFKIYFSSGLVLCLIGLGLKLFKESLPFNNVIVSVVGSFMILVGALTAYYSFNSRK